MSKGAGKEVFMLDKRAWYVVAAGVILQLITTITQHGYLHSDQHFQYIEFAGYWLGQESYAPDIWEFHAMIRPTIGIYAIGILYKAMAVFAPVDPYFFHTTLRLITALGALWLFNAMTIYLLRSNRDALFYALVILNFSWCFPYVRTLAGSEMWGGIFFFAGLFLYLKRRPSPTPWLLLFSGFILSLSFFFRFQMGFAILAMFLWILIYEKRNWYTVTFLGLGFAAGLAANVALDSMFYSEVVLTPVRYFEVNILEGKAAEFGTSPFTFYFVELFIVLFAPLLSIVLFIYLLRASWRRREDILVWCFWFFLMGHSIVAHKEERFLFPMFGVLGILVAYLFIVKPSTLRYLRSSRLMRYVVVPLTLLLNTFAIVVLAILPYSQTMDYNRRLSRKFNSTETPVNIYFLDRSPFETSSRLRFQFYLNDLDRNINLKRITNLDTLQYINSNAAYFTGTFNKIKSEMPIEEFEARQMPVVMKSSELLWNVNAYLDGRGATTIDDIWILTRLDD